jgi:hypothetical protein
MHLASALSHPPSSSLTQGSQRTACGRWRRRADAGRSVTQRSAAQYDGGGAGDSARSPTPATPLHPHCTPPLHPPLHPLHPLHPHCTPNLCFTSRRASARTFAPRRAAAGLRRAGLRAAGLPTAGLLAAAAVALPAAQHAQYAAGHAAHPHGAAVQHEHDVRRPVRPVSAVAVRPARHGRWHAVGIL